LEIVKTQNFLKAQGIPYHFMSYVNYWSTEPYVSRNGDFGVLGNKELEPLVNAIDFDPWIFSDSQRNGLYELAKEIKNFQDDGFHPGPQAYQSWAELIDRCIPSAA
jgi:lysophospholipase L1-like esterase